jgi:hypothetical protein
MIILKATYICTMNSVYSALSKEQRSIAIQRLTALWAFTESGLGGIMHALQFPFTGLLVGGMAVIMICLIADMSERSYKSILKSAIIVLIVKAMVSPYTPFTAYIAVSFQALLGFGLFSLLRINFISILLLSTIAMLESAMQKILVLTLFFGKSLWKAMDSMLEWLSKQLGSSISNGSYWVIAVYLFIYLAGGIFIAWLAKRTIRSFKEDMPVFVLEKHGSLTPVAPVTVKSAPQKRFKKIWILIFVMLTISAMLFIFSNNQNQGWLEVAKTISWTISAILLWFMVISPLLTKAMQRFLHKNESRYSDEVLRTLSFLPVLKQLTGLAWQQSKLHKGANRLYFFFVSLIHATLTYSDSAEPGVLNKSTV